MGSPLPTGPLVNDGIWAGKDGSVYELRVGTVSGGALIKGLHWDGANLVWKATNTSLDASGNLQATNATLSGQITAETGAIGNWTIAASGLTATNIGLYSGAANTARIQVGSGSDIAGINATAAGSDIAFWAGDTHANRAAAEFRVTAAGALWATGATISGAITATSGTITGDFSVTSGGKLTASGGGIVLTHTGINIGRYENLAQTVAPPDTSKAITWYADPSNPGAVIARQYVSESSPGNPYWSIAVDPAGSGPRMTLWDSNEKYLWFDNITNVVGLPGVTWFVGGIAPITAHFDVDPNTAFWLESGSEFRAWTHLLPGEDFPTTAYNIGSASKRWGTIYANSMIISGAISGGTIGGAEWEYAGSMIIDANAASNTTVSIVNQNASYTASLDVEGNITLGGTVDGVDLASFKSAYDSHSHSWSSITSKPSTFAPSAHALVGADHTASGLTIGHVIRASGTGSFAWAQLAHSDLSGVGTNSHTTIDTHIATSDIHVAHSTVTMTAGDGLTGGGHHRCQPHPNPGYAVHPHGDHDQRGDFHQPHARHHQQQQPRRSGKSARHQRQRPAHAGEPGHDRCMVQNRRGLRVLRGCRVSVRAAIHSLARSKSRSPKLGSSTMMVLRIVGFQYTSNTTYGRGGWEALISGYNFSTGWVSTGPQVILHGEAPFGQVRLCDDGVNDIILLGDTASRWYYPRISVAYALMGTNNLTGWETGWSIAVISDETGITTRITPAIYHAPPDTRTFTAGNGLEGGGDLSANRTMTLGTPSSLTATSTNAVTSTSHTHAIDATIARSAITMTAGSGFAAGSGGDLTANRTFTLGTPGSLTATSTNAVTTNSHTHSITTGAAVALSVSSHRHRRERGIHRPCGPHARHHQQLQPRCDGPASWRVTQPANSPCRCSSPAPA
jgi:hypothetical protein